MLTPCEPLLEAWATWAGEGVPRAALAVEDCHRAWNRGEPLLVLDRPEVANALLEPLLGPALDALGAMGVDVEALRRFGELWDAEHVTLRDLFPAPGRLGAGWLPERTHLSVESVGFLAVAALRPVLSHFFAPARAHFDAGAWGRGVCPFCGAPPGFTDLPEDGQRRLTCHACTGVWVFSRTRCPLCGTLDLGQQIRLVPEGLEEEGYAVTACKSCGGYLKELDRRVRWNGGGALVEDWGSPHLDLVARRAGYWRPVPVLVALAD